MPKNKKKNSAKSRKPMDPIEEETASLNQELRAQFRNDDSPPTNSSTADLFINNNSPKVFRLQSSSATSHSYSNMGSAHRMSQNIYHDDNNSRIVEDVNANPLISSTNTSDSTKVKLWRLDDNSSITKLLFDSSRFPNVESMFRPHIEKADELKSEMSPPFEGKDKRKINKLDSEIYFLNGARRDDVRFINVTKNNLNLYELIYEYNSKEPKVNLCINRQIPAIYGDADYTCRCIALDNSKENRIALGLNCGEVFVTSVPVDREFNFSTSYHIKMRQNFDSIVGLAFDKTSSGQSYLSCGYERGRESEHFISLYDVNQGKDLILDRDVSEKILGMQFLSSDLAVLLINCMRSVRFVDIRERNGFAAIINLNQPLCKVAIEPYNNIQFAGVVSNELTVFDRRFLSKALYEFQVGPSAYNISHLEWNPNRFANITCCSYSSNTMFELDIFPGPKYQHHLIGNKTSEPQEAIVTEYTNTFSYALEKIVTPLSAVHNFAWCHQKPNIIVAASPCSVDYDYTTEPKTKLDRTQIKVLMVENDRRTVSVPPDNSILYCDDSGFNQLRLKPQLHRKQQTHPLYAHRIDSNLGPVIGGPFANVDSKQERLDLTKQIKLVKSKPTFELKPEEIDLLFEMEQRELELLNEKIDYDHFETRTEDVQRHIPFLAAKMQARPTMNKTLQLWFTRSDINQLSINRAKLGYGFATIPGSAKAMIESSYYAIKDRVDETQCLKDCWRMLLRIYSSPYMSKLQNRYGTVFPGIRRMSHKLNSKTATREDKITFRNKYYVSEKRDDILRLVGWVPLDKDFREEVANKLERLSKLPDLRSKIRAATMSMFYLQGFASKEYLEQIANYLDTSECLSRYSSVTIEKYRLMVKKMLDVIQTNDGIAIKGFNELLIEIEDPYLNIMLQFLGRRQFTYNYLQRQIMATDSIRLDDRIAIAAIHMDDESFRYSMKMLTKGLQKSHDPLSVLLISGLDDHRYAHLALHSYLKQTNDIQTTALILCAGNCFRLSKIWETYDMRKPVMERILIAIANNTLKNTRKYSLQVVCAYMEWLQANNLTLGKSYVMTFLRKKIEFGPLQNDPKIFASRTQGLIACNFCGKPILPFIGTDPTDALLAQTLKMPTNSNRKVMSVAQSLQIAEIERRKMLPKSRGCPHCSRPLPRCLICKRVCIQQKDSSSKTVHMSDWFIWCTKCAHGGHLNHLRDWFSINPLCPAGDCNCPCPKIDNIFNVDYQAKRKEQDLVDDPFLINGFNVDILSATIDPTSRSRHTSEQDKMRLIQKLCMSPVHPSSAFDEFYRRGSNDSGVTLNVANPLKSICSLNSSAQFIGSNQNLTAENISAMSNQSLNNAHASKQLEDFRNINASSKEDVNNESNEQVDRNVDRERTDSELTQIYNMTPEIVKQSNAMRKLLKSQNLKHTLGHLHSNTDLSDHENNKSRLLASSDNLSVSELSRTQRRQHVKLVPKKQGKWNRLQQNAELIEQQYNTLSLTDDGLVDSNKWVVSNRDKGRSVATQVKVNIDANQNSDNNEPTSSQSLEQNVRFNQHNILLPIRKHPLASAWLTNPQVVHQFVAAEMFKAGVAEEKADSELADKKLAAQLVKEQLAKEQSLKETQEHRKQIREKANMDKNLKKLRPQTGSSYMSFDCGSIDIQAISSGSDDENTEDAEEVAKLCAKVDENIKTEQMEIDKLRKKGYRDLNSLATALKEAEEKKKRNSKKRVRIRTTPEVRVSTPAFDYNDEDNYSKSDISPRQRKNSTRGGAPTSQQTAEPIRVKERKSSAERKLSRKK